jgi:uncharacterized NAD(P)/FAD-binding protein YdhS
VLKRIDMSRDMRETPFTVSVIGGGFTGAAAAIACLEHVRGPFRLVLAEPSAALGRGVAYGSHHPLHLLNVRTRDLSIRAGQPGDFLNWAFRQLDQGENHAGLHEGLGHTFLPRQLFGEYVRQRLYEAIGRRPDIDFALVAEAVRDVTAERGRYRVAFERADPVCADIVILATAYGLQNSSGAGALAPFQAVSGERFARAETILLIGSGLTMVDMLLGARREGFRGKALVVSRRGQLPRPHAPRGVVPQNVALPRSRRVSMLATGIRIACEMAEENGTPWQAVINGLRASLPETWQGLPVAEQARFLRHLRPFWDAHRHRLPMEIHASLMEEFAKGRAELLRGQVKGVIRKRDGFAVTLVRRGGEAETLKADLAFDCSGFTPDLVQPVIRGLTEAGLAKPDPHRLGLAVEPSGQILGAAGQPSPGLYAIGPLCQGTLWEITAVPEIVRQADRAAQAIAASAAPTKPALENAAS